jgi:hypothetical protein
MRPVTQKDKLRSALPLKIRYCSGTREASARRFEIPPALPRLRSKLRKHKRNADQYKWFVLHLCANFTHSRIVRQLGAMLPQAKADRLTVDAARKGISAVRRDLLLPPKRRADHHYFRSK